MSTQSYVSSVELKRPQTECGNTRRGLTHRIGTSDWRAEMDSIRLCSIDDCERRAQCTASDVRVCLMHYKRWKRRGTFTAVWTPRVSKPVKDVCSADGCTELEDGGCGYCKKHMTRIRRHGNPITVIEPNERAVRRGDQNYAWTGDQATYRAAHQRVRKERGSARLFSCVDCGGGAAHWSYDRADPDARVSPEGMPYSVHISHYEPRCVPCHKRFDMEGIRESGIA